MTRKDYVLIAGAIAWSLDHHCDTILERHGADMTPACRMYHEAILDLQDGGRSVAWPGVNSASRSTTSVWRGRSPASAACRW